jgi:hypothetical protein
MWYTPFKSGELLLEQSPSPAVESAGGTPVLMGILVTVFVVLALLLVKNFLHVLPFLWDSVFRARGSVALENNVRVARERNQQVFVLMIPAILFIYRYRLYDARFLQSLEGNWRLAAVAGVFLAYLLLRYLMYLILKPKRRSDHYRMAHRAGFTFFILLLLPAILGVIILYFFRANDFIIKSFLYILAALTYLVFLVRKSQILSLSCNPLLTFLYLCGLEILPTGALIATAVLL